jgi:hypothetical protein
MSAAEAKDVAVEKVAEGDVADLKAKRKAEVSFIHAHYFLMNSLTKE